MNKENMPIYALFCIAILSYTITYALNIFLAHHLTADVYGDYNLAIRLLAIFVAVSLFGTNMSANRFLAKYLQLDDEYTAAGYIAWNLKLISVTFLIALVLAIFSLGIMAILHFLNIHDINQYHLAIYMLWITPFAAIDALLRSFLRCSDHIIISTIFSNVLLNTILLVIFMIVILGFARPLNNITIVTILFLNYVFITMFVLFSMNSELLLMIKSGLKQLRVTQITHTKWLQTSSRLISNNIIFLVIGVLDLLIVEIFSKNKLNVGHYTAVLTISAVIWVIPINLYQGLKPKISSLFPSEKGRVQLQKELDKINIVVFIIIAILESLIIYFSKMLLSNFGLTYLNATPALILLTTGLCFLSASRMAEILLSYTGLEQLALKINILELTIMLILLIPATYFYGITGAAAATAVSMIFKSVIAVYMVRKKLDLRSILFF